MIVLSKIGKKIILYIFDTRGAGGSTNPFQGKYQLTLQGFKKRTLVFNRSCVSGEVFVMCIETYIHAFIFFILKMHF